MNLKRFWLWGGVIGILYSIFVVVYYLIYAGSSELAPLILVFLNLPTIPVFNVVELIIPSYIDESIVIAVLSFPVNFLIGAVILGIVGLLYKKLRGNTYAE